MQKKRGKNNNSTCKVTKTPVSGEKKYALTAISEAFARTPSGRTWPGSWRRSHWTPGECGRCRKAWRPSGPTPRSSAAWSRVGGAHSHTRPPVGLCRCGLQGDTRELGVRRQQAADTHLARILDTQPLDTWRMREMSHDRTPEWAISTILWRMWSGSGRPLTYTPPIWLTPVPPASTLSQTHAHAPKSLTPTRPSRG